MEYQPTAPAERCTAHDGAHALYLGRCYAFGGQVARPARFHVRPIICRECGDDVDVLKQPEGRVLLLTAGTDRRHHHPPREAPTVEIDEDRLAAAIVKASRAVRQERQPERRAVPPVSGPAARPPEQPPVPVDEPLADREIPTVTVWSPGPDDGAGE